MVAHLSRHISTIWPAIKFLSPLELVGCLSFEL